jgi:beta-glucosidase
LQQLVQQNLLKFFGFWFPYGDAYGGGGGAPFVPGQGTGGSGGGGYAAPQGSGQPSAQISGAPIGIPSIIGYGNSGGNGYVPISLQLKDYTATAAREKSIAAGDPVIDPTITNRSYKGKTIVSSTYPDLQTILDTKKAMNGKPVIVSINISNPMVVADFEKEADAIVGEFGVQVDAMMDIIAGKTEPSGLLPMQMPKDMTTVEKQLEDVPHDMTPYKDIDGNSYDFAFGLNWKGVIKDARTKKYSIKK